MKNFFFFFLLLSFNSFSQTCTYWYHEGDQIRSAILNVDLSHQTTQVDIDKALLPYTYCDKTNTWAPPTQSSGWHYVGKFNTAYEVPVLHEYSAYAVLNLWKRNERLHLKPVTAGQR